MKILNHLTNHLRLILKRLYQQRVTGYSITYFYLLVYRAVFQPFTKLLLCHTYFLVPIVTCIWHWLTKAFWMALLMQVSECIWMNERIPFGLKISDWAYHRLGMIISAIPWGYLSDKLGRRKLLIYGYLLDSLCVFMCALSQNVWTLIFFKFMGGIM